MIIKSWIVVADQGYGECSIRKLRSFKEAADWYVKLGGLDDDDIFIAAVPALGTSVKLKEVEE